MNPVGPEPPSVYWRRRLLVVLAFVIVLFLLWLALFSGNGGSTPAAAPTSPTATPTPSDTATASPSASGSVAPCADSDIAVTASVVNESVPVGGTVSFKLLVANKGTVPCSRNVGTKVNTLTVSSSGGTRMWSSDDCSPGGQDQVETIPPGSAFEVTASWNQAITQEGCPSGLGAAKAGQYQVVGTNAGQDSAPAPFTLTAG